jgi:type IV conjugative transfer system coupling protein TraD
MNNTAIDHKNFTRGGQITLHNIRMYAQVMDKVVLSAALVFVSVTVLMMAILTSDYERYLVVEYAFAKVSILLDDQATTSVREPNGEKKIVRQKDIVNSETVNQRVKTACRKSLLSLMMGLIAGILALMFISRGLKKRGEKQAEAVLLKGDRIFSASFTKKMIVEQNKHSELMLAGLPLIKNMETGHLFFHGTTGSGKSNAIKELLDQIRKRGDRAIIYDKSCNFLQEFYHPKKDILLNPMDKRGQSWDLWSECRDAADFDSLAAAQIPMPPSNQDPFWVNASRTIFSAAAFEMRNDPDRSVIKLLSCLLTADLGLLQHYLKGTEAESLMSDKIEKTAVSVKAVLATYLKSLKYVKEGNHPFSIRRWIQEEHPKQWLFITSLGDRHETLKPLISTWLDIAVNSLLSLEPSETRRIWFILDELPTLQPLPYLTHSLSESRKFGGCMVIGIQNYAQLAKYYGHDGACEISALLNTRFMFRQPDPEMATWAAKNFGETFVDEVQEGQSYGANSMRDGVSINHVQTRKQVVSYSEIMSLANLCAYVRLPGNFPITRVNFKYKERDRMNVGYLKRDDTEDVSMKKVNKLLDKYGKSINETKPSVSDAEEKTIDQVSVAKHTPVVFEL